MYPYRSVVSILIMIQDKIAIGLPDMLQQEASPAAPGAPVAAHGRVQGLTRAFQDGGETRRLTVSRTRAGRVHRYGEETSRARRMSAPVLEAAGVLARALAVTGAGRLLSRRDAAARPVGATFGAGVLQPLVRRLATSPVPERRAIAPMLDAAITAHDWAAALALLSTAGRRPDLGAEKILSRRFRFLWICNPKVASRSMIAALRRADPEALLIRGRTLGEVLAGHPEARDYFRFAFVRRPCCRVRSFLADKHTLAERDRRARRHFITPWHGLRPGMSFDALCRWLATPCGADAFADRHWLSQSHQLRDDEGRLPDFLGRYEHLEPDWQAVTGRLGLRAATLPRLNASPDAALWRIRPDAGALRLLRRRYGADFALGNDAEYPEACPAGCDR